MHTAALFLFGWIQIDIWIQFVWVLKNTLSPCYFVVAAHLPKSARCPQTPRLDSHGASVLCSLLAQPHRSAHLAKSAAGPWGFRLVRSTPFEFEARLPFCPAPARETLPSPSVSDTRASPVIPAAASTEPDPSSSPTSLLRGRAMLGPHS
jgi:hypothetical protein